MGQCRLNTIAKYAQIGNKFYTVGEGSNLQEISANDIVGRTGTANASIEKQIQNGDIAVLDPSRLSIQPGAFGGPQGDIRTYDIYYNGQRLSLGGSGASVTNIGQAQAIGINPPSDLPQGQIAQNQDFSQYLQQTGQTYNPSSGFSGSPTTQSTAQYRAGVASGTLDPNTGQVYNQVLDSLKNQGYVINPKANLDDPSVAAEFLKRAEAEVSPGYQAQFRLARENILRNIGYDEEGLKLFEQNLEQRYGDQLKGIGEEAASMGFAQSGRRVETERNLAQETQQKLNEKRRQLGFQAGGEALGFIERFGTQPISGFGGFSTLPQRTLGATPQVQAGTAGFTRPGIQQSFYSLSPEILDNIVGSQQKSRQLDIESLAQGYQTNQNQLRTLPL